MTYLKIKVPDINDSVSDLTLDGVLYKLRFTWSESGGYWTFGLAEADGTPIFCGIRLVPNIPLNLLIGKEEMPHGVFGVLTNSEEIGRSDFANGRAEFIFIPTAGDK